MRWRMLVLAAVMGIHGTAGAGLLRVPENYPSVLEAVDAAVPGDSVLVGAGTWTEHDIRQVNVLGTLQYIQSAAFLKPGVAVVGTEGASQTVLDGGVVTTNGVCTAVHTSAGSETTVVAGFTVTGGGNGLLVAGASPLRVERCRMAGNARRGVEMRESALVIVDCVVSENEQAMPADQTVGGLWGIDVDLVCERTTFSENPGPGLYVLKDTVRQGVVLRDCVFHDNGRRGAVVGDADVLIERCQFVRNRTAGGAGGGLDLVRCAGAMSFCTFAYDSAAAGGGAALALSQVTAMNSTFVGCHGSTFAGALYLDGPDVGTTANIFALSTGQGGAVRKEGDPNHATTGCNLFWANGGGDYGGNWAPASTDVLADPLFCDMVALDFTLNASSPAAPANSPVCGLIGAWDVGCGAVSLERESWGKIKGRYHRGEGSAP